MTDSHDDDELIVNANDDLAIIDGSTNFNQID